VPDNIVQAAVIAVFRAVSFSAEVIATPPRMVGKPLKKKPKNPHPVIILHGVTDTKQGSYDFGASLRRDGFTVYTPTLPVSGMDGVDRNVEFLEKYVAEVMRQTGAKKVDLIGHSQGGVTIQAFVRAGNADLVDSAISIGAPHHGVAGFWRPLLDAVRGSKFLQWAAPKGLVELDNRGELINRMTAGDETPGNVRYTSIYSKDADGLVIPADSAHLEGAKNVVLDKERGPFGRRGPHHLFMNHSDVATYEAVRAALLEPPAAAQAKQGARARRRRVVART
jgi:triacylglycerol esterase/lipase EstA (alpha/beta hydrolase family)